MKLFLFAIIYLLSLIFEISFISFLDIAVPVSFWVFVLCVYSLRREDIFIFGALSAIIVSIFVAAPFLYPLAIILGSASAFLFKSWRSLSGQVVFMGHVLSAMAMFYLARVFIFSFGPLPRFLWQEALANLLFLLCLLVLTFVYEAKRGFTRGYNI